MKPDAMAEKIKELRTSLNLAQKQLAERLNVSDKAVSKWEQGLSCLDLSLIAFLIRELEITTDELLNEDARCETEGDDEQFYHYFKQFGIEFYPFWGVG